MTAQIEPKAWVQCVDDSGLERVDPAPRRDGVYYVSAVEHGFDWTAMEPKLGLFIDGLGDDCVWNPARFRPLGGNSSQIERKARVSEPA